MKSISMRVPVVGVVALAAASLAILGGIPASATTLMRMSPEKLIDRADLIFVGEVLEVSSAAVADNSYAFTFVDFLVEETLKGDVEGSELTLRFDGGEVGDVVIEYEGMPSFQPGQRVLLFVKDNGRVGCPVLGWWQGRLDFLSTPEGSVLMDASGGVVTGLEKGEWQRVSREQLLANRAGALAEPAVEVLWTDGVEIEEPAAESVGEVMLPEAAVVLETLRDQVRDQKLETSFRRGIRVESARVEDLPLSVQIRPAAPPEVQ